MALGSAVGTVGALVPAVTLLVYDSVFKVHQTQKWHRWFASASRCRVLHNLVETNGAAAPDVLPELLHASCGIAYTVRRMSAEISAGLSSPSISTSRLSARAVPRTSPTSARNFPCSRAF